MDDCNDDPTVGEELAKLGKVKLLRNHARQGLMRSRSTGVRVSRGEVVVFLDSHCEVEDGWLEPLLHRIVLNRRTIASPIIENINFDTFKVNL